MKRVSASEARKNWFRLLDEVVAGEVVIIERNGCHVVMRRGAARRASRKTPDYSKLLRVPNADDADRWSWIWKGPGPDMPLSGEDR